jgi:hypothetical protein
MTAAKLIRWSGLSAMLSGTLFIIVQPLHPHEVLSSVSTTTWAVVHYLTIAMCIFGLYGSIGMYARQLKAVGWLGFAGFLLLSLWQVFETALVFIEAFILRLLTTSSPSFVEGYLGLSSGKGSEISLGALPALGAASGVLYLLGGMLFGISMFRARILSRWASALLAIGALCSLAASVLPHDLGRIAAVPVGISLIGLGYSLWSERREN